jgi:hypothetical protein
MNDDHKRVWENGTVWMMSKLRTMPGMFNASIQELKKYWRPYLEAQMKAGDVLSYKVFVAPSRGEDDADLMLMVEYKNWAVFDRGPAHSESLIEKTFGTFDRAVEAKVNRQSLRHCLGDVHLQEIRFSEDK